MAMTITKQPLKVIEIPLNKFNEVIPHHQKNFEQHKVTALKLISQNKIKQVQQECKNNKRSIKQLKDLMYELDTLRAQVEDADLDKFDTKTLSLRKIILNLITGYQELEKKSNALALETSAEINEKELQHPFQAASQLQLHDDLEEVKLKQRQDLLNEVETIHRDTKDLHEMFTQLNDMVGSQQENVTHIEESVEGTNENVKSGLQQIVKAHKIRAAAYPVTGAFIGGIIGGPIGLVAGLKVGGLTALGCAIAGYTGGKFFKKAHENEDNSQEVIANVNENNGVSDDHEKKHI